MQSPESCNVKRSDYNSLKDALTDIYGKEVSVLNRRSVSGGDINEAFCLTLSNGEKAFLKRNTPANYRFFLTETHGLSALMSTEAIGVPEVYGCGCDRGEGYSFLLMENLDPAGKVKNYWELFGHQLAMMHHSVIDYSGLSPDLNVINNRGFYGFYEDNYIGANGQKNEWKNTWIDFFRDCRLLPQIAMADHMLDAPMRRRLDELLTNLDRYLREPAMPSLLHGDLWSGNAICGPDGRAWIIDPAVYIGDRETDLAMTQLFGGFPSAFYASYHETFPIDSGYEDRRPLYNLYHILNHANLFGRGYLREAAEILNYYI